MSKDIEGKNKIYDALVYELERTEKILITYCKEHCTHGERRVIESQVKQLKDYCAELTKPVVPITASITKKGKQDAGTKETQVQSPS